MIQEWLRLRGDPGNSVSPRIAERDLLPRVFPRVSSTVEIGFWGEETENGNSQIARGICCSPGSGSARNIIFIFNLLLFFCSPLFIRFEFSVLCLLSGKTIFRQRFIYSRTGLSFNGVFVITELPIAFLGPNLVCQQ